MEITLRREKRMRSLVEIINDCESGRPSQRQAEYDIPKELLEFILSDLNLRDNIRASAVSTRWLDAAVSMRKANSFPLLMICPKHGDTFEFYDPSNRKTYYLELPELRGSKIRYARNNWLLLERPEVGNLFLFCPYSRKMVALPQLPFPYEAIAFSSVPTSHDCVIFALSRAIPTFFGLWMYRLGADQWEYSYQEAPIPYPFRSWSQVIFSNGNFYCLSLSGQLGIFNVVKRIWVFSATSPSKFLKDDPSFGRRWTAKFMAEHDGTVYIVGVCPYKNPDIYMLNKVTTVKLDSLCGLTIFMNDISSQVRVDLTGKMVGNLVFSKVMYYGRRCVTYDPWKHRYYPTNRVYNWNAEDSLDRVWIDVPENMTSIFH